MFVSISIIFLKNSDRLRKNQISMRITFLNPIPCTFSGYLSIKSPYKSHVLERMYKIICSRTILLNFHWFSIYQKSLVDPLTEIHKLSTPTNSVSVQCQADMLQPISNRQHGPYPCCVDGCEVMKHYQQLINHIKEDHAAVLFIEVMHQVQALVDRIKIIML